MKKFFIFLAALFFTASAHAGTKELYFYNWSEYMPDSVLENFTKETGIKIIYTTYESNEALYAKMKLTGGKGYDLVVPSTYYVSKMLAEGLLQPLNKKLLPDLGNLNPMLLDQPFDPGNTVSIPYIWGTTGLAYNAKKVKPGALEAWGDLWKPEFKGRVLLQNDVREVFHAGLRVLGYSGNDTDPAHIEEAYNVLVKLMPSVRLFNSEAPKMPFLNGEVDAGMIWNGEAYVASRENPDIRFVFPREGAVLWLDSLVIPKGAKNAENAHAFINFILRPEIAMVISMEIGYATPNLAAQKMLPPEARNNRTVYPADEDLANAEYHLDIGPAITVYEKYWEKLKAGR
jgi:spermidine/putrescine transport system substrate-binding protein